ncbi:MAG: peroxiredoxin family protein [Pirellulaceae bacterium]
MIGIRIFVVAALWTCLLNCLPHPELGAQEVAGQQAASVDEQLDQLKLEFRKKLTELRRAFAVAQGEEEKAIIIQQRRQFESEIVEGAVAVAPDANDEDNAIKLMVHLWIRSKGDAREQAANFLMEQYADVPALIAWVERIEKSTTPTMDQETALRRLMSESSVDEVQGRAAWTLVRYLEKLRQTHQLKEKEALSSLGPEGEECLQQWPVDKINPEIEQLLEQCIDRWSDVEIFATDAGNPDESIMPGFESTLAREATARLASLQLRKGLPAPEIDGIDVRGQPLKLSDYRGKAVVLIFWSRWGPLEELLLQQRLLADELRDKPFAIVGVFVGDDAEEAAELDWSFNSFHDHDKQIRRAWNARWMNTSYLLDSEGKIFCNVTAGGLMLDRAVEELMNDMGHEVELVRRYRRDR